MKIPLQSRKRGSFNERLHLFAKDEKGTYPFYQLALVATRRKRVPYIFLSILLSLKTIGKGVKQFQDITP